MGGVDPLHRLSSNLSAILCLGINHTNPQINLRPLLDNTNIPLRVIQTNTAREGGVPSGQKPDRFPVHTHLHKNTGMGTGPHSLPPSPDVCFPTAP